MKRNPKSGITQLELMISLVIMSLIAVLLANALDFSRQSLDRSILMSSETKQLLTHHELRSWLLSVPIDYRGENASDFLTGTSTQLQFRSFVTDQSFASDEAAEFTLSAANDLIVTGTGQHPTTGEPHQITRTVSSSISNLQLSYFGQRSHAAEKQWYTEWNDEIYLPDLIKIEWDTSEGTPFPPLTIIPAQTEHQRFMSRSSLLPPG